MVNMPLKTNQPDMIYFYEDSKYLAKIMHYKFVTKCSLSFFQVL